MMNTFRTLESLPSNVMVEKMNELKKIIGVDSLPVFEGFILTNNVCMSRLNHYKKKSVEFSIDYFLGFSSKKNYDIIHTIGVYEGRMPNELFPIAIVDGGDLLCMHKSTGNIYYWFHEEDDWGLEGNQKYPAQVGTDLNSFIDNLTTSPQPTQEEIRQVMKHGSVTITPKYVEYRNNERKAEGLPPLSFEEWDKLLNNR